MSKRNVVVLWIVAILLAAAAFLTRSRNSEGSQSKTKRASGEILLKDFPAAQVSKIQVNSGEKSTVLVRKDGKWNVENREAYPAKVSAVNDFLRSLAEVKVTQGIESDPSFVPRFGMDPAATKEAEHGVDVIFSNDAGTELSHLTFGKNLEAGGDPMAAMMGGGGATGRFVRDHADSTGVYKVSELFPTLTAAPEQWLDDSFLKVEKIKDISVSPAAQPDKIDWKVTRADENAEFTLDGAKEGEVLDAAAAGELKTLFSYARFEDVVDADTMSEKGNHLERRTVKIETFEGFKYTITFMPMEVSEDPAVAALAQGESFLMTVDVSAEIPAERKKEDKETEEDAKTKDKAFADRKAVLEKRLAAEKALAGRNFKVAAGTVEALNKKRATILKKDEAAAGAGAGGAPPDLGMPPGGAQIGGPGAGAPRRRAVEAVTPPIAIPPLEEGEGEEEEGE